MRYLRSKKLKRIIIVTLVSVLVLLVVLEVVLRVALGLGNPPLLVADKEIGYYYKPNQDMTRFGNHVAFNSFGQRSDELIDPKPENLIRVLFVGDSVALGGVLTDQEETIAETLEDILAFQINRPIEVLNASAGGWSMGNVLAYVQHFGTFDADVIVHLVNTIDVCEKASTSANLDKPSNNAPTKKPYLALQELVTVYLPRYVPFLAWDEQEHDNECHLDENFEALDSLVQIATEQKIPYILVLSPVHCETLASSSECKERVEKKVSHRDEFLNALARDYGDRIQVIDLLRLFDYHFENGGNYTDIWRDAIHYNRSGNLVVASAISAEIVAEKDSLALYDE